MDILDDEIVRLWRLLAKKEVFRDKDKIDLIELGKIKKASEK